MSKYNANQITQQGTISLYNVTSNTATITAIDTAKPYSLIPRGHTAQSQADDRYSSARLELTNSTTITATLYAAAAVTTVVGFEITGVPL
jgi:hypothetical protein